MNNTLLDSRNRVRRQLLKPKESAPNDDLIFGELLDEFQNIYNELSNSSLPWTFKEFNITPSANDVLVGSNIGKILQVRTQSDSFTSLDIPFTDIQDASTSWWYYQPIAASRPEDYGNLSGATSLAFYRKNGSLYARVPQAYSQSLTVIAATGDWSENVGLSTVPVMQGFHHLPEIRVSNNLLGASEWDSGGEKKMIFLQGQLPIKEKRVYDQFIIAKRSVAVERVVVSGWDDPY